MNAGDFHLDHNASVEFSKRLDLKFPDGTPESKVEQELRAQDFQKDDVLTKVSAADYSDKVVAYIKPRPSEEWTAAMVDSIIAEAKMREVKMTKHYSFTRSGLISENTNWNVSWRLDGNGNVSNVHGCVIKSLDAI